MRISLVSTPQFILPNFACLNAGFFLKYRDGIWGRKREKTMLIRGGGGARDKDRKNNGELAEQVKS